LNPEKISPMLAGWLRLDAGLRLWPGLGVGRYGDQGIGIRILAGGLRLGRDDQRKPRETADETPRKKIPEANFSHKAW